MNAHRTLWGYPNDSPRGNAMEDFIFSTNLHILNVEFEAHPFNNGTIKAALTSRFQLTNIFRIQHPEKILKMLASVTIILSKFNLTLKCNLTHILGRQVALNTPQLPATLPQHSNCLQGSCTGPALWNLVAKKVLTHYWPGGVYLQVFSDDFIFLIKAPTKTKVKSLTNEALNQFESWTAKHNLEISAYKSNYIYFNKNRNGPRWSAGIRWEGDLLRRKSSIKYLVVFVDDKLNFATHLTELKNKTLNLYQKLKIIGASNWGLNKIIRRKIYFTVIERILLYGAPARANNITSRKQRLLNAIQRKSLLNITGEYSTTPNSSYTSDRRHYSPTYQSSNGVHSR
ncbi:hypothetical protein AVEN_247687-1 [Araneus ventricosus]|uniref:Reverse transcriptase domain-containing protein n=1 Tax=Araneus ventricosus TaxID=182803 RepID=A0A4Y2GKF1_ARAVE|nr:hypothetical protein AVEN_247687-1 [Araneus ventricosus]